MTDFWDDDGEAAVAEAPKREFLTVRLGGELFGIDILRVQEIRRLQRATRIPGAAPWLRGVINLRGAIVPILDLGLLLGFAEPAALDKCTTVILNLDGRLAGIAVQAVADVVAFAEAEIHPAPDLGNRPVAAVVHAVGLQGETSLLLLDADAILQRLRNAKR